MNKSCCNRVTILLPYCSRNNTVTNYSASTFNLSSTKIAAAQERAAPREGCLKSTPSQTTYPGNWQRIRWTSENDCRANPADNFLVLSNVLLFIWSQTSDFHYCQEEMEVSVDQKAISYGIFGRLRALSKINYTKQNKLHPTRFPETKRIVSWWEWVRLKTREIRQLWPKISEKDGNYV